MKSYTEYLVFETRKRKEMVHITDQVEQVVRKSGVKDGLCFVSPMHITAAIYVNDLENGSSRTSASGLKSSRRRSRTINITRPARIMATPT
jgi:thiamine phosphate synthase YjbQ (UPF0047 family)